VNDAFRLLKSPQSRATALLAAEGRVVEEHHRADPAVLTEMMELREELESLRSSGNSTDGINGLREQVQAMIDAEECTISEVFDDRDYVGDVASLDRAYGALVKLRYLYRFMEEADAESDA